MTPLKPGDRVACYGNPECGSFDCPTIEGDRGVVVDFDPLGWVGVKLDANYGTDKFIFHPKQLRRLKPRTPKKPVKVSLPDKTYSKVDEKLRTVLILVNQVRWDLSNMPEKIPGTVTITREDVAKAYSGGKSYLRIEEICKALGFPEGEHAE